MLPHPTPSLRPIGIIGIGLVGFELARHLLKRGQRVLGYDLDEKRRDELLALGGEPAGSAAEVISTSDLLLLSLPSHKDVTLLFDLNSNQLRAGQIIIDTTTGDPASSQSIAATLAARGVGYLDATISGSSKQVRDGSAIMMVGGDAAQFEACKDIFAVFADATFHTGPSGTGAKMKLVTNLVLGLNRAALAEGLAFAAGLSLDPALTLQIMRRSAAYSRAMDVKGHKMIQQDFTPEARLSQHLKDVRLIVEAGLAAGLPMPLSQAHRAILEQAEAQGLGELDNSAIIRVLASRQPTKADR